jgi:hypothetical protein
MTGRESIGAVEKESRSDGYIAALSCAEDGNPQPWMRKPELASDYLDSGCLGIQCSTLLLSQRAP